MALKLFVLIAILHTIVAVKYPCSTHSATLLLKRPSYEFSVKILERVAEESDGHFVFSPMSTWLQLLSLSEGSKGRTLREIWRITKYHRNRCFRRKLGTILWQINRQMKYEMKSQNVIAIDRLMAVKKSFVRNVKRLYGVKVLLLDFNNPVKAAAKVNQLMESGTNGKIPEVVYYDDFINTVLLVSDAKYFESVWLHPFDAGNTRLEDFYSSTSVKAGQVSMMTQTNLFNVSDVPILDCKVLELPFADGRSSMLIFLPLKDVWIGDVFYNMEKTRIAAVFNMFKFTGPKLVEVKLPRFKITSNIENIPELIFDMGIKRVFNPDYAEFGGISDFKLYTSLMTQVSEIFVSEKGARAHETARYLIKNNGTGVTEFNANRPFVFLIVDKITEFIIFSGSYSVPSIV